MLIVEAIAKVRRAYFSDGKSIKASCRELSRSKRQRRRDISKRMRGLALLNVPAHWTHDRFG